MSIEWSLIWSNLLLAGSAYLLALPIAWNREKRARSAGMRTYPLVALATCCMMLIGIRALGDDGEAGRIMQAVITGMGFIGGGAILKSDGNVTGMATAASLWATGAIGIAVAWQRFEIAVVISLLTFLTLELVKPAVRMLNHKMDEGD